MAYTMAATLGGAGARPKLTDFLLRWRREKQSAHEQLAVFRALAERMKGRARVDHR